MKPAPDSIHGGIGVRDDLDITNMGFDNTVMDVRDQSLGQSKLKKKGGDEVQLINAPADLLDDSNNEQNLTE